MVVVSERDEEAVTGRKAEITMVAESVSPLLSKTDPKSFRGDIGSILSVQASGPYSFAKSQEDDVSPRE